MIRKRPVAVHQPVTDFVQHTPCGLIRDAQLALQVFGADRASRLAHQIGRVEPKYERCAGLVKNRASGRMKVVAAAIAIVGGTALHSMKPSLALAFWTECVLAVLAVVLVPQVREAGCVVGELAVELHDGVLVLTRIARIGLGLGGPNNGGESLIRDYPLSRDKFNGFVLCRPVGAF